LKRPKDATCASRPKMESPRPLNSSPASSGSRLACSLHSPLATRHSSLATAFLIAGQKILKTRLTPSAPMPSAVLIAGICPTFSSAPLSTHHSSLTPHHRLTPFLFDTNKPHKIIIRVSLPMKTKEKQFSIRYKWSLRGTSLPAAAGHLACASFGTSDNLCCDNSGLTNTNRPSLPLTSNHNA
jgi:hypothetical protein